MLPFLLTLLVAFQTASPSRPPQSACDTWQDCRDKALAAAGREDFELFHDLAWRAFQKGPKNDGTLMTMLARAQSMSGRPHDALVMLNRLADLGIPTDAAESDDFQRVRALPGWSDLQTRTDGRTEPAPSPPRADATPKPAAASAAPPEPDAVKAVKEVSGEAAVGEAADALRFTTEPFVPAGLAYDTVSNRFIVADRRERKLSVIGERSQRMSNLVGAESGGFGEIGGIAIDRREGDLWVASTAPDAGGAKLHKLQLISGRVLLSVGLAAGIRPASFGDIALTPSGDVLALDVLGRRIFRLRHGSLSNGAADVAVSLDPKGPTSIAPASDTHVYVAHRDGISRVDLESHSVRDLKASGDINLTGLTWIRWHRGHLLAVQRSSEGTYRIVRIRLDGNGETATRLELLERSVALPGPSSISLTVNTLYYLTVVPGAADAGQHVVRRIALN